MTRTVALPEPTRRTVPTPLPFDRSPRPARPTAASTARQRPQTRHQLGRDVAGPTVVLLRPLVTASTDPRLDQRELELAWGCQVVLDDLLRESGLQVVVDRRDVVQSWQQRDLVTYARTEAAGLAPHASIALLTRFCRDAPDGARAEGIIVDLHEGRVVTRGRAQPRASKLMRWLVHVPDHVAFALGEPTPKLSWQELMGVRDAERAIVQVRLAGALARLARLGPA